YFSRSPIRILCARKGSTVQPTPPLMIRSTLVAVVISGALAASAPARAFSQQPVAADDKALVRAAVARCLHGLKFNDTTDFHRAFWPEARLLFIKRDGSLGQLTQAEWYR